MTKSGGARGAAANRRRAQSTEDSRSAPEKPDAGRARPRRTTPPRDEVAVEPFRGFGSRAFELFVALEAHNHRDTFEAYRDVYEHDVRAPLTALLSEWAAERGGAVRLFRPHNSRRFRPDAPPYKTTCYGVVYEVPGDSVGWYAELSARGLYVARGFHDMARDQVRRLKAAVDDPRALASLRRALDEATALGASRTGEAVSATPKARSADRTDGPHALVLGGRALAVGRTFAPSRALHTRRAASLAAEGWAAGDALARWLHTHVGPSEIPPEVRWGGGRRR
jgi:hypothetical protein